jgi:methylamine---glutamate N-methyltransferase subunit B
VRELAAQAGFSHIGAEDVTRVASAKNLYRFDALKDQRY